MTPRSMYVSPTVRGRILQTDGLMGYRSNMGPRVLYTGLDHNIGYFLDGTPGISARNQFS